MSKKFKTIVIVAAALVILAVAVFFVMKLIKRDIVNEPNLTLFKCHIGREVTDAELGEIKDIIEGVVAGKFLDISKGSIPYKEILTSRIYNEGDEDREEDEYEYEEIPLGDSVTVTLSVLTDEEKAAVFTAVAKKYNLVGGHLIEIKDIYRND